MKTEMTYISKINTFSKFIMIVATILYRKRNELNKTA